MASTANIPSTCTTNYSGPVHIISGATLYIDSGATLDASSTTVTFGTITATGEISADGGLSGDLTSTNAEIETLVVSDSVSTPNVQLSGTISGQSLVRAKSAAGNGVFEPRSATGTFTLLDDGSGVSFLAAQSASGPEKAQAATNIGLGTTDDVSFSTVNVVTISGYGIRGSSSGSGKAIFGTVTPGSSGTAILGYAAGTASKALWGESADSTSYRLYLTGTTGGSVTVADNGTLTLIGGATLLATGAALTAGATGNVPTLTAGPVTGNPTKWIAISDNGVTRYIPCW